MQAIKLSDTNHEKVAALRVASINFAHVDKIQTEGGSVKTKKISYRVFQRNLEPDSSGKVKQTQVLICPHCGKQLTIALYVVHYLAIDPDQFGASEHSPFRQAIFNDRLRSDRKHCYFLFFPIVLFVAWLTVSLFLDFRNGGLNSAKPTPDADNIHALIALPIGAILAGLIVTCGYMIWKARLRKKLWSLNKPLVCPAPRDYEPPVGVIRFDHILQVKFKLGGVGHAIEGDVLRSTATVIAGGRELGDFRNLDIKPRLREWLSDFEYLLH